MRKSDTFSEQQGFFTFVQNNSTTDYLNLAYCQALSIKCTQKINSYAIAVDSATKELITDRHRRVFNYIIDLPEDAAKDDEWKLKNEWQVWWITPFKETIKVESDILFTSSIDHWWAGLQQKEVCLTSNIRNYEGVISNAREYRRLFDDNLLPDVYNGLMYFRYGRSSKDFFIYVRYIFENWNYFKENMLKNCRDDKPTTDVVFAIAAEMLGIENCTNPVLSYPTFTHMKGAVQGWGTNDNWLEKVYAQISDDASLQVGFTKQQYPFHYQQKQYITPEIIQQYEGIYNRSII